jgi:hypothetical protein
MKHPIYRVVGFEIVAPYTLQVCFDDATVQTIDFRSVLLGELFAPLNDVNVFNGVRIDPEIHTWCGRMVQTSIRRPSMIGRCSLRHFVSAPGNGKQYGAEEPTLRDTAQHNAATDERRGFGFPSIGSRAVRR